MLQPWNEVHAMFWSGRVRLKRPEAQAALGLKVDAVAIGFRPG